MAHHELTVNEDGEQTAVTTDQAPQNPARLAYTVLTEAGLFQEGKLIAKGETVELDADTAGRFIELGDIEAKA